MAKNKKKVKLKGRKRVINKCGLCGDTSRLMKTECCGNWICDDEDSYVPFSYSRDSCNRNHRRNTLCGYHYNEGHPGRWQDCEKCKADLSHELEMYVWLGTNEYNFEKLANPPEFDPTHCCDCGRQIVLSEGGYSVKGDEYTCDGCLNVELPSFIGGEGLDDSQFDEDFLSDEMDDEMIPIYDEIVGLTDAFCEKYLNDSYMKLCDEMAEDICTDFDFVRSGRAKSWASGIVHAVGMVNFLSDPSFEPYMTSGEVAVAFGVSQGTMTGKSKIIRDELGMMPCDPEWTVPELLEDNPLVWMYEAENGMIMDIRNAPLDFQEAAFEDGRIPFIPSKRESKPVEAKRIEEKADPSIIRFPVEQRKAEMEGPGLFDDLD